MRFGKTWFLTLPLMLPLLLLGCEPEQQISPEEDIKRTCTNSEQCANGEVCNAGLCIIGECVVRADCSHPGDQLCKLNYCVPDPDSPIGNECPNGDRDCDMGEFCSAGSCYDVSQSVPCRRSSDCSAGERCDPINGFCVEDRGGCNRAEEYPELACPDGDVCDAMTGHCNPPTGIPCTPATASEDCGGELQCISSRCVQCTSNSNCGQGDSICCEGFGTQCNIATGRCVSAFVCSDNEDCTDCRRRPGLGDASYCADSSECAGDSDCSALSNRRCSVSTGECVLPECQSDGDCASQHDSRWTCDTATWRCYLPAADCSESNEPNNFIGNAIVMTGTEFTDVLCRGDVDMIRVDGQASTRLRVSVSVTPSGSGISVRLLDENGSEIDQSSLSYSSNTARVSTNVGASAHYFVSISGTSGSYDSYNYTVTVESLEPLQCDSEPGEPNDAAGDAGNSVLQVGTSLRALCGTDDEDYHQITAQANLRTIVKVTFLDSEGNINAELLGSNGTTVIDDSSGWTDEEIVRYSAGDQDETLILHIDRSSYSIVEEEQEYAVEVKTEALPDCADGYEPNNNEAQASSVGAGTFSAAICDMDDEDWWAITLPAGGDLKAIVSFIDAEGDLEVKLLKAGSSSSLDSSTTTGNIETVERTNLEPGTYYIRVYPYSGSYPQPDRQPYSIEIQATHFCMDDELGMGRNNDISRSLPIRDDALSSFAFDQNLKLCSAGDDWYRLLLLGDEFFDLAASGPDGLHASLFVMSEDGRIEVATSQTIASASGQSQIAMGYHVPGRGALYYLRVGGGGDTERSYHLGLGTYLDECAEDATEFNDVASLATHMAPPGDMRTGLVCPASDVDVFHVAVASGTQVHAELSFDGTLGDLDLIAVMSDNEIGASRTVNDQAGAIESLDIVSPSDGHLHLTVRRHDGDPGDPVPYDISVSMVGSPEDAGQPFDAAADDSGASDAGVADTGSGMDAHPEDTSSEDMGAPPDGGVEDVGLDAGSKDLSPTSDAMVHDVIFEDAAIEDTLFEDVVSEDLN